jgi:tetratricopeptide (TPR) repeat protein
MFTADDRKELRSSGQPDEQKSLEASLTDRLAERGYWAAIGAKRLSEGKYSEVIGMCRENSDSEDTPVSARLIYAQALYCSGQIDSATDQFHKVLAVDPENIAALKYLGDISNASGDSFAAMANYGRVLEIDPYCRGLASEMRQRRAHTTRTITLLGRSETRPEPAERLREIPFFTETIGDLYLAQGHPRLAATVFRKLIETGESPRIAEKLSLAESKVKEKEN